MVLIFLALNLGSKDIPNVDDEDLALPNSENILNNAYFYLLEASNRLLVPEGMKAEELGKLPFTIDADINLIEEVLKNNQTCFFLY